MLNSETSNAPDASVRHDAVLLVEALRPLELESLAERYGVQVIRVARGEIIAGSYWGESEAGLISNQLYVRCDTPVHSALHELCHYVCMPSATRATLDTNAGGDYDEENGVCYLQILLADHMVSLSRDRMLDDMDRWGYTFRLGSARAWFEHDAEDAKAWLIGFNLIDSTTAPTWNLREDG